MPPVTGGDRAGNGDGSASPTRAKSAEVALGREVGVPALRNGERIFPCHRRSLCGREITSPPPRLCSRAKVIHSPGGCSATRSIP